MLSKRYRNLIADIAFLVALVVYLLINIVPMTFFKPYINSPLLGKLLNAAVLLLFLRAPLHRQTDDRVWLELVVTVFVGWLLWHAALPGFIPIVAFVYAGRNVEFRKVGWTVFWVCVATLVLTIGCAKAGLIYDHFGYVSGRMRHFLGFTYCLIPVNIFTNAVFLWVYLRKDKIRIWEWAVMLVADAWLYYETRSRLSFALVILAVLVSVLLKYVPDFFEKRRGLRLALTPAFVVACLLSLVGTLCFGSGNAFLLKLDAFLGGRLEIPYNNIQAFGFSLLGQEFSMFGAGIDYGGHAYSYVTSEYTYIDNMYMQIMQRGGIVMLITFVVLFTAVMIHLAKKEPRGYGVCLFALLALQAIIQDTTWYPWYTGLLFLLGDCWADLPNTECPESSWLIDWEEKHLKFLKNKEG